MSNVNLDNSFLDPTRLVEGPPSTISSYASEEEDIASTISSLDHVAYREAEIQRLYPRQVNASTSTAPVRDDCSSDSGTCDDDDTMTEQQVEALDDLLTYSPTASKAKKTRAPRSLPAISNSLAAAPLPSTPYIWWRDAPDSAFRIWDTVPSLGLLTEWALTKA